MTTDVGTTVRKPLTRTQRLAMFEAHKGLCCICKLAIQVGDPWLDEHIRPLALGGSNDMTNRGPAHTACAAVKTEQDMEQITKAKRVKAKHVGAQPEVEKKLQGPAFAHRSTKRDKHPIPMPQRITDIFGRPLA